MSMIVGILENFLGKPKNHYENKSQVNFDCPMCAEEKGLYGGDGKGNLSINYERGVYKCWSCWERNNMSGGLIDLIKKYGNKHHLRDYILIAPKSTYVRKDDFKIPEIIKLPDGFKLFSEATKADYNYNEAYKYVKKRGLTDSILHRYGIGFTASGKYKNRIIIPSYDVNGEVNYFVARSFFDKTKPKYLNPDAEKKLVIFNEGKINWDSTIYLVEGGFDHIVLPNSIPLLGKFISPKLLISLILKAKKGVIIVLDGGDEEEKDAVLLYKKLNISNLYNKVKVVVLTKGYDLSKIYELRGPMAIVSFLRKAHRLVESRI